jgi:hypothetical protein
MDTGFNEKLPQGGINPTFYFGQGGIPYPMLRNGVMLLLLQHFVPSPQRKNTV